MFDLVMGIDPARFYAAFFPGIDLSDQHNVKVVCPFHADTQESLSINLKDEGGLFYCFGCGARGNLVHFYKLRFHLDTLAETVDQIAEQFGLRTVTTRIDPEQVNVWHEALMLRADILQALLEERCITEQTVLRFRLGFDVASSRITIPIMLTDGRCVNVRKWLLPSYRRSTQTAKCVGVTGSNAVQLFPVNALEQSQIILCEGEIDCMLLHQYGFNGLTTTGGVQSFTSQWIPYLRDKDVVLMFDNDTAGREATLRVRDILVRHVAQLRSVTLPPMSKAPEPDIADYCLEFGSDTAVLFKRFIDESEPYVIELDEQGRIIRDVNLIQAGRAMNIGKQLRVEARITGKYDAPYAIPKKLRFSCSQDMPGRMCVRCPFIQQDKGFEITREVLNNPFSMVTMLRTPRPQQYTLLLAGLGVPNKCVRHSMEVVEYKNIEELQISPDVTGYDSEFQFMLRTAYLCDYNPRLNDTYLFEGETIPDPKTSEIVHVFYKANPAQTAVDQFSVMMPTEMNGEEVKMYERLKMFQCKDGDVEAKLRTIYRDLESNVTHVIKRGDVLQAIDMAFHSIIKFRFDEQMVRKGWMDVAIIGDTKTGKSETMEQLLRHYQAGEMLNAEQTSRVGITGGYISNGQRTRFVLGRWPLNDRRFCCIDEFTALSQEEIGELTRLRSTGVSESAKQGQINKFFARVRFVALMNPRNNRQMSTYGFGCQAVNDALGADADVSRWDLVVAVSQDDVTIQDIHNAWKSSVEHVYTADLCHHMVMFAWSRKESHIMFTPTAIKTTLALAESMSQLYTEEIPLAIGSEFRYKLARLSAAIATRLFHVDGTFENVIVDEEHVHAAANFVHKCYDGDAMGLKAYSVLKHREKVLAPELVPRLTNYLQRMPPAVIHGLRETNTFTPSTLEIFGAIDSYSARELLSKLYEFGCIRKLASGYVKTDAFITFFRTFLHDYCSDTGE